MQQSNGMPSAHARRFHSLMRTGMNSALTVLLDEVMPFSIQACLAMLFFNVSTQFRYYLTFPVVPLVPGLAMLSTS